MGERKAPIPARLLAWAVSGNGQGPVKPQNGSHRPSACRDGSCLRPLCAAYREGREDGYQDGFDDGFGAGVAAAQDGK
jgi:hypothetical protein